MRLIVGRCEVRYSGRLTALLPEALRLLMIKADGSVLVHADARGYKQLTRYLERMRLDPGFGSCRGVLVAQTIKPQARVLAQSRGIDCAEVDLATLRGEREPELKLFAA